MIIRNIKNRIKNIKENIKNKNGGLSMVEILFYVAVFSVLFLVVINSMIFMTKSFRETVINTDLTQSSSIMERISREIRSATGIVSLTANSLKLNIIDVPTAAASTIRFTLNGTNVELYDGNDVLVGNLNSSNVSVTALNFVQISTTEGLAVRVFMTVKSNHYNSTRTENFYDTIVLRGDYE